MSDWESLLMVIGGVLVGVGAGLALGQRAEAVARRELRKAESLLRRDVLPLLEEQAQSHGISRVENQGSNAVTTAAKLAKELRHLKRRNEVAFSDTVDAQAHEG